MTDDAFKDEVVSLLRTMMVALIFIMVATQAAFLRGCFPTEVRFAPREPNDTPPAVRPASPAPAGKQVLTVR